MKSRKISLIIAIVILLVGIVSSIDLTYIHFKVHSSDETYKSFCNINDTINCDAVALTSWAKFSGVPISILGLLSYSLLLAMAIGRLRKWKICPKNTDIYMWWIGFFSIIYTVFLAWICYAKIGSWCLMCLLLYAVNIAYFALAWILLKSPIRQHFALMIDDAKAILKSGKSITLVLLILTLFAGMFGYGSHNEHQKMLKRLAEVEKKLTMLEIPFPLVGDIIGNPEGKVVVVLLSDYQCPFCTKMDLQLEKLTHKYSELKILRRDFPLDQNCNPMMNQQMHPFACMAAKHKTCAAKQGKFLEYHSFLLHNREKIGTEFLKNSQSMFGLDQKKMQQCLDSPDTRYRLRQDIKLGLDLKITGTPTLIFDGKEMVTGGITIEEIEELIRIKSQL